MSDKSQRKEQPRLPALIYASHPCIADRYMRQLLAERVPRKEKDEQLRVLSCHDDAPQELLSLIQEGAVTRDEIDCILIAPTHDLLHEKEGDELIQLWRQHFPAPLPLVLMVFEENPEVLKKPSGWDDDVYLCGVLEDDRANEIGHLIDIVRQALRGRQK